MGLCCAFFQSWEEEAEERASEALVFLVLLELCDNQQLTQTASWLSHLGFVIFVILASPPPPTFCRSNCVSCLCWLFHLTIQQQVLRGSPSSSFPSNLFWHCLCDNMAGWPFSRLSHHHPPRISSVLAAHRGAWSTGPESWMCLSAMLLSLYQQLPLEKLFKH